MCAHHTFFSLNSGFDRDPTTSKFEIHLKIKQVSLIGPYKVRGSVIILPVRGSGPANLTLGKYFNVLSSPLQPLAAPSSCPPSSMKFFAIPTDNIECSLKLIPKVEVKNGKQYVLFTETDFNFSTTR